MLTNEHIINNGIGPANKANTPMKQAEFPAASVTGIVTPDPGLCRCFDGSNLIIFFSRCVLNIWMVITVLSSTSWYYREAAGLRCRGEYLCRLEG